MGNLAMGMMGNSIGFYLLLFYTDVVGLSGALVGAALAVGRLWDAITDPMMGHISDRTRSRFGRRRPYVLFGMPLFAVAFVLLWWSPIGHSSQIGFAYLVVAYFFFTTMLTIVMIPYGALGVELTSDYHERNSVMAYQQATFFVGMIVGACLINLASVVGEMLNPQTHVAGLRETFAAFRTATGYKYMDGIGFRIAVVALAPIAVASYLVAVSTTRENPAFQRHASTPAIESMFSTLKNRPFRIYIAAFLIITTAGQIGVMMLPYLIVHWFHRPGYVLPGYVFYSLGLLAGLPFWRALGQRYEKNYCYIASLGVSSIVHVSFLFMVRQDWPPSIFVWAGLIGFANSGLSVYPPSMMADIVDTDELECGLRREGAFIGVNNFIMKCATSLGALWVGPGLSLVGYDGHATVQSDRTLLLMRLMYVFPQAFNMLVIAVLSRFPLTANVMEEVHRAIRARGGKDADGTNAGLPAAPWRTGGRRNQRGGP
jgi:Na+/melibiose symporter-like transporter